MNCYLAFDIVGNAHDVELCTVTPAVTETHITVIETIMEVDCNHGRKVEL